MNKFFQVLLFLFISSTILAQKLDLGFRAEYNGLKLNIVDKENNLVYNSHLPSGFQILAGIYLSKNLSLQPRLGTEVKLDYYAGMEYSLFLNYNFAEKIYVMAGIIYHSTIADWNSDSKFDSLGTHQKRITMPAFGLGFKPYRGWVIELIYLDAGEEEIAYTAKNDSEGRYLGNEPYAYLDWGIKLSFGYTWTFPYDN